jgi:hypothetical protein
LAEILVRESSKPLPADLFDFVAKTVSLCQISSLVLKPANIRCLFHKELSHDCRTESHIYFLPSLKETLAKLDRSVPAIHSFVRVEFNQSLKRAAV